MKRFCLTMQTIPATDIPNEQVLWVNLHISEPGEKNRIIPLVSYHRFAIPDAAAGSGLEWAVEISDIVYQVLTEKLGEVRRRPSESEVNARPSDASTN